MRQLTKFLALCLMFGLSWDFRSIAQDLECNDGEYGEFCEETCGACLNMSPCNKSTGYCPGGECSTDGYIKPLCKGCIDGTWGGSCEIACGKCLNGAPCDKWDGTCTDGCHQGYEPPMCQNCITGNCEDPQTSTTTYMSTPTKMSTTSGTATPTEMATQTVITGVQASNVTQNTSVGNHTEDGETDAGDPLIAIIRGVVSGLSLALICIIIVLVPRSSKQAQKKEANYENTSPSNVERN